MFCPEDETHRSARNARANLSTLCTAPQATVILNSGHPVAILVPVDANGSDYYTTKDKRLARANKLFHEALKGLRTP